MISEYLSPIMAPNKISAWSKSSRKSRGPSAPRRVLWPSAVFVVTSLLWRNKAIASVWSPVNSLLGFHSPLLALYSHEMGENTTGIECLCYILASTQGGNYACPQEAYHIDL